MGTCRPVLLFGGRRGAGVATAGGRAVVQIVLERVIDAIERGGRALSGLARLLIERAQLRLQAVDRA